MNDDERKPWDRQAGESSKAYHHLASTAIWEPTTAPSGGWRMRAQVGANVGQLERWSSRWKWVERCQKYDDYLEREARWRRKKSERTWSSAMLRSPCWDRTSSLREWKN